MVSNKARETNGHTFLKGTKEWLYEDIHKICMTTKMHMQ